MLNSAPGILLSIVAGTQTIGMLNAGKSSRLPKIVACLVTGPAPDHNQRLDLVLFQNTGDFVDLAAAGYLATGAELGAALWRPAADALPAHFKKLVADQTAKAACDAQRDMSSIEAKSHHHAYRRVHPGRRTTRIQHSKPNTLLLRRRWMRECPDQGAQEGVCFTKAGAAHFHRLFKISAFDGSVDFLRLLHAVDEGQAGDAIITGGDEICFAFTRRFQHGVDRFDPHDCRQNAIIRAGRTTALDMAEHGNARVFAEIAFQHLAYVVGRDCLAVAVTHPFGNDYDIVAPAIPHSLAQHRTHPFFPIFGFRRALRNNYPFRGRR